MPGYGLLLRPSQIQRMNRHEEKRRDRVWHYIRQWRILVQVVFIELPTFTRLVKSVMSDDEYAAFQEILAERPDAGSLIPGSGGLRKIRWRSGGRGKSGGVRFIYYWLGHAAQIRMLYVCSKGKQVELSRSELAQLRQIVEQW